MEKQSKLKAILFTHNDLDGAGCITVFELAYHHLNEPVEQRTVICSNDSVDIKVLNSWQKKHFNPDTLIYFADVVPSRAVLESLVASGYKVMIFDHHKTSEWITEVLPNQHIIVENELGIKECGASLMLKYFMNLAEIDPNNKCGHNFSVKYNTSERLGLLSDYIEAIRSYDTFDFKVNGNRIAKKMSILFSLLGPAGIARKYSKRVLGKDNEKKIFSYVEEEFIRAKLKAEAIALQNFDENSLNFMKIDGLTCAIKFIGGDNLSFSDLAYEYLKNHTEIDIFIGLNLTTGTYSFRTQKENIDVADIALKKLNGGGHSKASGAPIPVSIKDQIIKELILNIDKNSKELNHGEFRSHFNR